LPGWQKYLNTCKSDEFDILSVSVDIKGGTFVKPYTKGYSFRTVVDSENQLASFFGFKMVPNGILLNKEGNVLFAKEGFDVNDQGDIALLNKHLQSEINHNQNQVTYKIGNTRSTSIKAQEKFNHALQLLNENKKQEALKVLDEALQLDSNNFVIRKQRWYIRYPEKFSPEIDYEWQKEQLEKERSAEIKQ
jgi:hypothetical protein